MNRQEGVGLSELLIALLLASLTTMVLMRHYLNTKQQYSHIQTALEQSIDLQLVTDLIRDSARRAGFTPCSGIDHLMTIDRRKSRRKIVAIEVGRDGDPSLHINRMSEHFDTVIKALGPAELLTSDLQTMYRGQSILVADCYHAEVQSISQLRHTAVGQRITLAEPLVFTYQDPIYIGEWLEETFYIHPGGASQGSLFYHLHHAEELTTVVHQLSAHMETYHGRTLLQVTLGLDNMQTVKLETMVRTI